MLSRYPGLASLLGAKKAIAKKAAVTRRLNKKAVAEGKAPIHGRVGKKRQRAAEKAAAALSSGATAAHGPTTEAPAEVSPAPVPAVTVTNGATPPH